MLALWRSLTAAEWEYRYRADAWTVKDIAQHQIDVERVFSYRALRFGRGDSTALPGFDVDAFAEAAGAHARAPETLIEEFRIARESTIAFFESLPPQMAALGGEASGAWISARAAGFKLAGHDHRHCDVIEERYLSR